MSFTLTGLVPAGQPLLGGGGGEGGGGGHVALVMTAVGTEFANVLPSLLTASTLNRSVLPASTEVSVYVLSWAPLMLAQLPPFALQRVQKKLKSVGLFLQSPLWPVRIWPTWGVPVIVGGVFCSGFACEAAIPD